MTFGRFSAPPMYSMTEGIHFNFNWDDELEIDTKSLELISQGIDYQRYAVVIWVDNKSLTGNSEYKKSAQLRVKPGFRSTLLPAHEKKEFEKFRDDSVKAKEGATGIVHVQTIEKVEEKEEALRADRYIRLGLSLTKHADDNPTVDKFVFLNRSTQNNSVFKVHPLALGMYAFRDFGYQPSYDMWFDLERSIPEKIFTQITEATVKQIEKHTGKKAKLEINNCYNIKFERQWYTLWELPDNERNKQISEQLIKSLYLYLLDLTAPHDLEKVEEILINAFQFATNEKIKIDFSFIPSFSTNKQLSIVLSYYRHPLLYAIEKEKWSIVRWLISLGAIPDVRMGSNSALMCLVIKRNIEMIEELLKHDVNQVRLPSETALIKAVEMNALDIARLLLKNGADPNNQGKFNEHPLVHAPKGTEGYQITKLLLEYKADPDVEMPNKDTLLCVTVESGDKERVKLLLQWNANPNKPGIDGVIPLLSAFMSPNILEMAKLLLEKNANPNVLIPDGDTLLCIATLIEDKELVKLLLQYGADPNQAGNKGIIPLGLTNDEEMIKLLKAKPLLQTTSTKEVKSISSTSSTFFPVSKSKPPLLEKLPSSLIAVNFKLINGQQQLSFVMNKSIEFFDFYHAISSDKCDAKQIGEYLVITIKPKYTNEIIDKLGLGEYSSQIYDDPKKLAVQQYARGRLAGKEYIGIKGFGDPKSSKLAAALLFLADKHHNHLHPSIVHSLTHGKLKSFIADKKRR